MMSDVIAIDSETHPIDAGLLAPPLSVVSTCDQSLSPRLYRWCESFEVLRDAFKNHNIVGSNFAFDSCVFAAQFPELLPTIFQAYFDKRIVDTQHNERLIDIARGTLGGHTDSRGVFHEHRYGLAALSERYGFGTLDKKTYRLAYGTVRDLPFDRWFEAAPEGEEPPSWGEGMRKYAMDDALTTFKVFSKQMLYGEFLVDAANQAAAGFCLQLMSCRGMITDARACDEFIEATKKDIARAGKVLEGAGILRPANQHGVRTKDTKVAKALMESVCHELGIPVPKTKKTKNSSETWVPGTALDAEATRGTGDATLMDYSLFVSADKALNLAEMLKKGSTGTPLQTSFEVILETGRISSRKPMAPMVGDNFTALPRKVGLRECFIPRRGFLFCSIDLSMAEIHAVSQVHMWVFGRSSLGEALNNNRDVHCHLAAELLHCPYEEVEANKKLGKYAKERQNAKYGNFGFWGGMGVPKFTATSNTSIEKQEDKMTLETGAKIKLSWKKAWAPESDDYFNWTKKLLGQGQATIKQFVSGRVRANLDYCTTANTFFQGLVADAVKAALLPISHECYCVPSSPLYGSRPLLDLHDEIFLELVEEKAHEAAHRARDIFLRVVNERYTPDVPMRAEPALMRRWMKKADPVYVNGQLVPWEPVRES